MIANQTRKEIIADLIENARGFRLCGPSDDPDRQTGVTSGYCYLVVQFKRLAGPILSSPLASRLNAINVDIDNLYSAYDAKAELDSLIPEIEAALERLDDEGIMQPPQDGWFLVADSRITELRQIVSSEFDFRKLVRLCEEINSVYSQQCYYASAMLIRSLLDHVPPVFGFKTFSEVANNYVGGGKSFKEAMLHLENTSRKVADSCLHMPIRKSETLPTAQQVNCAQQLDVLLSEIVRITQ